MESIHYEAWNIVDGIYELAAVNITILKNDHKYYIIRRPPLFPENGLHNISSFLNCF